MKNFSLLLFALFLISSNVFAQSNNFRFKKLLAEHPNEKVPFAVTNTNGTIDRLLADKEVTVKQITKNWIYLNASPSWVANAQENKIIDQFHYEFSAGQQPLNDSTRVKHFINEVHAGAGGLQTPFTGDNVIIGFVDQGLDHSHPDFQNIDGTTRVLYYWDQTMGFDAVRTPQPYNYGQLFYASDINLGNCPATESGTAHGTTVAAAAAANGLANGKEKGMAPDCNLIVIETNFSMPNWTLTVADACDFIFAKADSLGVPAVVNLSVGSYLGSHDGNDPAAELMEDLLDEQPGRIIVCAAGNSGNWGKYHVQGNTDLDTSFVWIQPNPGSQLGPNTCYMDVWSDLSDATFSYAFGANLSSGNYQERDQTIYRPATFGTGTTIYDTLWNNGNRIATLEAYPEIVGNTLHIEFYFNNVDSTSYLYSFKTVGFGKYDAWTGSTALALNNMVTNIPSTGTFPAIAHYHMPDSLQTIVSSWNCSEKVVTVGNFRNRMHHIDADGNTYTPAPSYTSMVGQLSINSSKGPSRHGVVKPDVAASGDVSLSAGPLSYMANPANFSAVSSDMLHMRNGGTSMASPVVAGIAALYLEKCYMGTYQSFLDDLHATSYTDTYTGAVPNFAYGYGKPHALNLLLASNYTSNVDGQSPACINDTLFANSSTALTSAVWNTTDTTLSLPVPNGGDYSFTAYDAFGCKSMSDTFTVVLLTPAPQPVITLDGTYLVTADYPDLQWYQNGVLLGGETDDSLLINTSAPAYYNVVATSVDGCSMWSDTFNILLGLDEISISAVLYPNPASSEFRIDADSKINSVFVYDVYGKKVAETKLKTVNCSSWSKGSYMVIVNTEKGSKALNFIKE